MATWNKGTKGNFWDNYTGIDNNGDGIGDTPYIIDENNQDNYPLMAPVTIFEAGMWEWKQYYVDVISNSTVYNFSFNPLEGALVRFTVSGEDGTAGFCRVTIPKGLLDSDGDWLVSVGGELADWSIVGEDSENTVLYFTYSHSSKTIEIEGTSVIPEFPSWAILPILLIAGIAVILVKKKAL